MADEAEKAKTATPGGDTIFGKILRGEIPSKFIYEDDKVLPNECFSSEKSTFNEAKLCNNDIQLVDPRNWPVSERTSLISLWISTFAVCRFR